MDEPLISQKTPYQLHLAPGKYYWCACGESKSQPFCDGSHKAKRLFTPIAFEITESKTVCFVVANTLRTNHSATALIRKSKNGRGNCCSFNTAGYRRVVCHQSIRRRRLRHRRPMLQRKSTNFRGEDTYNPLRRIP